MPRNPLTRLPPGWPRVAGGIGAAGLLLLACVLIASVIEDIYSYYYDRYVAVHTTPPPITSTTGSTQLPPPPAPPSRIERPPSPEEAAILAPLSTGAKLDDYTVEKIFAQDDVLRIDARREDEIIHLDVMLVGPRSPIPVVRAGKYGIYFQALRADRRECEKVARALAQVLEANKGAPVPPQMKEFPAPEE